ncbi:MAG: DUF2752 domain-containing protein [Kofleriaceae bacterium]
MSAPDATTAAARRASYRWACAIVLAALAIMTAWVALGHGFPGGSVWRRATGREGPTGGLTTAMRSMVRGDLAAGVARHPAAAPMFAFLVAQVTWRAVMTTWPLDPRRVWVGDLVASLALFAAAIYLPTWLA